MLSTNTTAQPQCVPGEGTPATASHAALPAPPPGTHGRGNSKCDFMSVVGSRCRGEGCWGRREALLGSLGRWILSVTSRDETLTSSTSSTPRGMPVLLQKPIDTSFESVSFSGPGLKCHQVKQAIPKVTFLTILWNLNRTLRKKIRCYVRKVLWWPNLT